MLRHELVSTAPFTAAFPVVEMDLGILQLNWTFAVMGFHVTDKFSISGEVFSMTITHSF